MSDRALLRLEGLSIGTGLPGVGHRLVKDIELELRHGEALGIVGESGSGKSLTALSIAGMLPASLKVLSGRILFEGRSIADLAESALHDLRGKEISYVFQDPLTALNPTLTVGTQLIDVLKRHATGGRKVLAARAVEALAGVGIERPEARMRSYPHQLSGGMRHPGPISRAQPF